MEGDKPWLLLIHQMPPRPTYFRVKIWRRLQQLGAIPVKNTVYVLPATDQTLEDFQWMAREIEAGGGDATLCEARFIEGLSHGDLVAMFNAARTGDYRALAKEIAAAKRIKQHDARSFVLRMKNRLAEIKAKDYFGAPQGKVVETALAKLETKLKPRTGAVPARSRRLADDAFHSRTWVTREGVHIDRIASAWLIRRFIDPAATFKFVPQKGYRPLAGELRFDMFEAEYTHEGDRCTFEVLLSKLPVQDHGLSAVAEIVHDIDLKDAKFGRPETAGIAQLISGMAMAHKSDDERLKRGAAVFDDLYVWFRTKAKP